MCASITHAGAALDHLAISIDTTPDDNPAVVIIIVASCRTAKMPPIPIASMIPVARSVVTRTVDPELKLDLGVRWSREGTQRDPCRNQACSYHDAVSVLAMA